MTGTFIDTDRPGWMEAANCSGIDPDVMFPVEKIGPTVATAKAICRGCDVQAECLAHALTVGEPYGVWGGFTESERRSMRRRQRRALITGAGS